MTSSSGTSFFDAMRGLVASQGSSKVAYTEKGAVSLPTSQPAGMKEKIGGRVDLFFKAVRGLSGQRLAEYLEAAWSENPLDTLRIIFQTRDCRGGKGERLLFRNMLEWLSKNHPDAIKYNLHLVPLYGRWDDVFFLPGGSDFLARQLLKDKASLDKDGAESHISLAAKWAPTERHALDKKYQLVSRVVKSLGLMDDPAQGITSGRTVYRKHYLTPLRKHLRVVERAMCAKEWETIDYSKVPSKAMKNYKKAFQKHDEQRFGKWQTALQRDDKKTEDGEIVKVNAKQLFPHELVKEYYSNPGKAFDAVTEEQWKVLEKDLKDAGTFEHSVCLCDVSGSMEGEPMLVSIALGVLLSSVTAPPFQGQVITFETNPQFHHVQGKTLKEKVQSLRGMSWGGSTQLQAAFDLILQRAVQFKVSAENMPKRLYIFSDMQFDAACGCNNHTNFETITAKYRKAGYDRPEVVFWNLRDTTSKEVPVTANENGVALLSGFSPSLLKSLLDGADLSPWGVIRKILDNPRYSAVTYPGYGDDGDDDSNEDDTSSSEEKKVPQCLSTVSISAPTSQEVPISAAKFEQDVTAAAAKAASTKRPNRGRGGGRGGGVRGRRGGKRKR